MAIVEVFPVGNGPLQFQISKPDGTLNLVLPEAGVNEVDQSTEAKVLEMDEAEAVRFFLWMQEHYGRKIEKARKARYVDVDLPIIDE